MQLGGRYYRPMSLSNIGVVVVPATDPLYEEQALGKRDDHVGVAESVAKPVAHQRQIATDFCDSVPPC